MKMKITKSQLRKVISETISNAVNEAHGLDREDKKALQKFIKTVEDKNIKRILRFVVKSNVLVDKTQDITKRKNKKKK
jgi:ribosomal protein L12E/L44/L45/RPP1/RPP2